MKDENSEEDMMDNLVKENSRKRPSPENSEFQEAAAAAAVEVELLLSHFDESDWDIAANHAKLRSQAINRTRLWKTNENSVESTRKLDEAKENGFCADRVDVNSAASLKDEGNVEGKDASLNGGEHSNGSVMNGGHTQNRCEEDGSTTTQMDNRVLSLSTSGESDGEDKCSSQTLKSTIVIPPGSNVRKRKMLLVLDLNGLLADIVFPPPQDREPETVISGKAVFKRPYCDDFLSFCFERFEVGIWSSRTRKNVDMVTDLLLGDKQHKLLFCWDASYCTTTQFKTLENRNKPMVFKELSKLWDKCERGLPWEKGQYNELNTLLLDDTPYKALLNPPHTAIFPYSYKFEDENDCSLGPGGDLRVYLEALAAVEDVQKFVKRNPFGQKPITESSAEWRFYFQRDKKRETKIIPQKEEENQSVLNLRFSKMFPAKRSRMSTHWSAPRLGFLKFNVDSYSLGASAGLGGVLRNERGLIIALFSKSIAIADSNVAELSAISEALEMFSTSSWVSLRSLVIESRSSRAFSWLYDRAKVPWSCGSILNKIDSLLNSVPKVKFDIVSREANAFADGLAKSGLLRQQELLAWI